MAPDRLLQMVGQPGGPLADASLWHLEVVDAHALTPSFRRVVLTAPGLGELRYGPGQDLMLRIPLGDDKVVNRRYTIRHFDPARPTVTVDVSLHGAGPGTHWIAAAEAGGRIDAIGPRGKIMLRPETDWHLFIADETGLPGALHMLESLPAGTSGLAVLEVDAAADEQGLDAAASGSAALQWLHREGRSSPGDAAAILQAVDGLALPAGVGHAYLAAEAGVVRAVTRALTERGVAPDRISGKAYWRRGLPNAEHGEPAKEG